MSRDNDIVFYHHQVMSTGSGQASILGVRGEAFSAGISYPDRFL